MTDRLREIAQRDTPQAVDVPSTWAGLIVWASARFGVGIIFAAVFGYATREVYRDGKARQDQLMQYVVERNVTDSKRAVSDAQLAQSLSQMSDAVAKLCSEARMAHNGNGKPTTP